MKCSGYIKHQVVELPAKIQMEVTEYRRYQYKCTCCSRKDISPLPPGASRSCYGPRLQAFKGNLVSDYRMTRRMVRDFIRKVLGIPISLGAVSTHEGMMSQALEAKYNEIISKVKSDSITHIDETRYKHNGLPGWLWSAAGCTKKVVGYFIRASRGAKVAKEILGEAGNTIVCSDRFSSYAWVDKENRQVCLAHIRRDFKRISERDGKAGKIGKKLFDSLELLFEKWHEYKNGLLGKGRNLLAQELEPIRAAIARALNSGSICGHPRTEGTCKKILELESAMYTFLQVQNLEPTNNHAERCIKPVVMHRKLSYGV